MGTPEFKQLADRMLKLQQAVAGLQAESLLRGQGKSPRCLIEFMSQHGEDLLAWKILSRQTHGFFIEAGAFDGLHYSITYGLEAMGWDGLLVEAIPRRAEECRVRRRHSRTVNAVLSDVSDGASKFHIINDLEAGMLSSTEISPKRAQKLGAADRHEITVHRTTLNDLLGDHRGPIDLVILDVEGDEPRALRGFDLTRS